MCVGVTSIGHEKYEKCARHNGNCMQYMRSCGLLYFCNGSTQCRQPTFMASPGYLYILYISFGVCAVAFAAFSSFEFLIIVNSIIAAVARVIYALLRTFSFRSSANEEWPRIKIEPKQCAMCAVILFCWLLTHSAMPSSLLRFQQTQAVGNIGGSGKLCASNHQSECFAVFIWFAEACTMYTHTHVVSCFPGRFCCFFPSTPTSPTLPIHSHSGSTWNCKLCGLYNVHISLVSSSNKKTITQNINCMECRQCGRLTRCSKRVNDLFSVGFVDAMNFPFTFQSKNTYNSCAVSVSFSICAFSGRKMRKSEENGIASTAHGMLSAGIIYGHCAFLISTR